MRLSKLLQIVHNISRALDVDSRLARLEERSRHMQINDESLCDSCHARLGTKLFAMYPDDTIVCYKVSPPAYDISCNQRNHAMSSTFSMSK